MQVILEFIKKNFIFLLFIGLGFILCLAGAIEYFISKSTSKSVTFTTVEAAVPTKAPLMRVSIDVSGKVLKPGVYSLKEGDRLQDALIAAGGLASGADRTYVSKRINLAQKVVDGAKLYIPAIGEIEVEQQVSASNTFIEDMALEADEEKSELININSASSESLDSLPKIGPVTAQKIIDNRPYGSVEELLSKKILGQKTFDGLRNLITVQ